MATATAFARATSSRHGVVAAIAHYIGSLKVVACHDQASIPGVRRELQRILVGKRDLRYAQQRKRQQAH
jgi:hypothetical protein